MKRTFLLATFALLLVASRSASADPVVLSYLVDEKALKEADAGTTLSFGLYSDSSCASLFQSFDRLIEDVPLLARVQRARPKGAPKPPRTVEIRLTASNLYGLPPNLYLQVTGVGVEAVGSVCQAQVGTGNAASHWIAVYTPNDFRSHSPDLVGTVISRPNGNPVGVYCVQFPAGAPIVEEGAVGSVQTSSLGYTIQVSSIYNHNCQIEGLGGVKVTISYFNGSNHVPTDAAFTLLVPGLGVVYP
jgi:hypothetical protein